MLSTLGIYKIYVLKIRKGSEKEDSLTTAKHAL